MFETFAREPRLVDGVDGPVEGYGHSFPGFLQCSLHNRWSEKVQSTQIVFLAVLVEKSPGTAFGHTLYRGEVIEVRKIGVVVGCHDEIGNDQQREDV